MLQKSKQNMNDSDRRSTALADNAKTSEPYDMRGAGVYRKVSVVEARVATESGQLDNGLHYEPNDLITTNWDGSHGHVALLYRGAGRNRSVRGLAWGVGTESGLVQRGPDAVGGGLSSPMPVVPFSTHEH